MEDRIREIFDRAVADLSDGGYDVNAERVRMPQVTDARNRFISAMRYLLGDKCVLRREYGAVVEWLNENDGRSLLLGGKCGTGKSLIATRVLPLIYATMHYTFVPMQAYQFSRLSDIPTSNVVIVDDIGTEGVVKKYGTSVDNFGRLVDLVDSGKRICIATTNLSADELAGLYGDRTMDRIRSNFKIITFDFGSMRGIGKVEADAINNQVMKEATRGTETSRF